MMTFLKDTLAAQLQDIHKGLNSTNNLLNYIAAKWRKTGTKGNGIAVSAGSFLEMEKICGAVGEGPRPRPTGTTV